jgi:hypothetical protein
VKIVLFADFMWDFEHAQTDAEGRYELKDLRARGWDMSAWGSGNTGNGTYKLWIDSDRFAVPTQTVTIEPGEHELLDLQAQKAGVIRVTVIDDDKEQPVRNVRIWGFDQVTGSGGRFNAYTDDHGRATFYSTLTKIWLGIVGPPDGSYTKGSWREHASTSMQFEFAGGEYDLRLVMPAVAGPLLSVPGLCKRPDGTPAAGASISSEIGAEVGLSRSHPYTPTQQADAAGRFALHDVPAGQPLLLYGETADRKFAGTATIPVPDKPGPQFRVSLPLEPTVTVEMIVRDGQGKPLASKKIHLWPLVGEKEFLFRQRTVASDADGHVKLDGIVRGLSYKI